MTIRTEPHFLGSPSSPPSEPHASRRGELEANGAPTPSGRSPLEAPRDAARTRWIVALSLLAAASMAPPALLQLGVVKDLPDPPIRLFGLPFRSRKVNLSRDARVLGMRDAPLAFLSFLANVPLARMAMRSRGVSASWLPLAFGAKTLGEAIGAVLFFSKMPSKEKAWCGYCIVGAMATIGVFLSSVPALAPTMVERLRTIRERRA